MSQRARWAGCGRLQGQASFLHEDGAVTCHGDLEARQRPGSRTGEDGGMSTRVELRLMAVADEQHPVRVELDDATRMGADRVIRDHLIAGEPDDKARVPRTGHLEVQRLTHRQRPETGDTSAPAGQLATGPKTEHRGGPKGYHEGADGHTGGLPST